MKYLTFRTMIGFTLRTLLPLVMILAILLSLPHVVTSVQAASNLTLEKQVSKSPFGPWVDGLTGVTPGRFVFYKFTVTNSGNVLLNGLSINDPEFDTSICDLIDPLAPGAVTTCVLGPFVTGFGLHTNVATAQATSPVIISLPDDATYTTGSYSIGGIVWEDPDADGVIDVTEVGLTVVTLELYVDDGNGSFDPAEDTFLGTTLTAEDGSYSFNNLPPGTYFVRVTEGVEGYTLVSGGSNPRLITLTDSDSEDNNFGYRILQADLAVTKTDGVEVVNANGSTTYTVRVTNLGPDPVSGATLVDTAGIGLSPTAVVCSPALDNQCLTAPVLANLLSAGISLPTLNPGQFYELELTATITATAGSVTNSATTAPPTGTTDPDISNNTASDTDMVNNYRLWLPFVNSLAPEVTIEWSTLVGYEDLSLVTGLNDYDYNDWAVAIDADLHFTAATSNLLQSFTLSFVPRTRGGYYDHTFQISLPAGTFSSNGTAVINLYDQNRLLLNKQTVPFFSGMDNTFVIFEKTSDVFPGNVINTLEGGLSLSPRRYADITITFNSPVFLRFDLQSLNLPHGEGLFFDPNMIVLSNNEQIHRGDSRLLSIPSSNWLWPEEGVRIDRAYPLVLYAPGTPPTFTFPGSWWTVSNNCVYNGIPCSIP
jgi:uncharacterized repeat protein (TIGR01451 family)